MSFSHLYLNVYSSHENVVCVYEWVVVKVWKNVLCLWYDMEIGADNRKVPQKVIVLVQDDALRWVGNCSEIVFVKLWDTFHGKGWDDIKSEGG